MSPTLILASSSPRRRELLSALGVAFTIIRPDIDETQRPGEAPLDYVRRLSREKAVYVAEQISPPAAVLAADTSVVLGADTLGIDAQGEVLGKPVDSEDARRMLERLRGRTHQVCTAITLAVIQLGQQPALLTEVARTDVLMRPYTDAEIAAYIASGDPFDKAGGYAIQHPVFRPVERIEGCFSNVVGLPVCTLRNALARIGWPGIQAAPGCSCRAEYGGMFFV
jgi:MAF protein